MAAVAADRRHKVLSFVATLRTGVWSALRDWFHMEKAVQYVPLFTYCASESAELSLLPCV